MHCANRPLSAFSSPPPCSSPAPAYSYVGSLVWLVLASALLVQACMYWTHLINPTIIFTSIVSPMVGGGLGCGTEGVLGPQNRPPIRACSAAHCRNALPFFCSGMLRLCVIAHTRSRLPNSVACPIWSGHELAHVGCL
jgi:hypothetical protein